MRLPTVRQLQLLKALEQYKSISLVAQQLHVSQPSVSIQLKHLSETVDMPVYRQHGKTIVLTDAGKALLTCANEVFTSFHNLSVSIDELKSVTSGSLNLCVVSTAKYFLPLILGAFCKKHPKVDINLKIGNRQEVKERIEANEDDFYFFSQCPERPEIIKTPLLDNELVVIAPARHELHLQQEVSLNRLSHYPFIMREKGSGTRNLIEQFCKEQQLTLNEKMTIESNEAIKYAVASGLGLSILSRHALDYGEVPGLVKLDVKGFPIRSTWFLAKRQDRKQSLLASAFEAFMKEQGVAILERSQVSAKSALSS